MSLDSPPADRLVLRRYLLGQLSPDDQNQVEEQFEDPAYFAEYQTAERLLVQEYAGGTMAPIEADLFARNYLVTRKRRGQVAIVRALLDVRSNPPSIEHAGSKRIKKWIPVFAMAASVIVAAIGWSHWRPPRLVQKAVVRPIESPEASVDAPPQPSPSKPRIEAHRTPSQATPPPSAGRYRVTPTNPPSALGPPAREPALTPAKPAREKELVPKYALTRVTADQTDIVTAGAILVLKKGNIVMAPVSGTNFFQNTYKDGKITPNVLGRLNNGLNRFGRVPGAAPPQTPQTRTFVPGEKVWVTKIERKEDGVVFDLYTDAYADVRYKASLKFYFDPKGPMPSTDDMDKLVAEVFKIQPPADDKTALTGDQQQQRQAPAAGTPQAAPPPAAAAPARALAPIAPPPKEIKMGQTKDEVVANLGQPEKLVKLGTKEIYYYKDLAVIFVNGKVTDVQ